MSLNIQPQTNYVNKYAHKSVQNNSKNSVKNNVSFKMSSDDGMRIVENVLWIGFGTSLVGTALNSIYKFGNQTLWCGLTFGFLALGGFANMINHPHE